VLRRLASVSVTASLLAVSACGGDADDAAGTTVAAGADPAGVGDDTAPLGQCDDVNAPAARGEGRGSAPADRLDPTKTWTLAFRTSCGTIVVTLDVDSAPETTASLVALAEAGFFDETVFHRIVPGFVIQGGDPTQRGSGGPGYSTVDEPTTDAAYTRGVVAMAKSPQEPAGTAGSQFFVVTGGDVGLPPEYAIVGEVTEGIEVVDAIGVLGDPATERPLQPVVVSSVTVQSS